MVPPYLVQDFSPPPPPAAACDKPHLGTLCGKDAAGAIAGIAIGGFLLLALIAGTAYYAFAQRVSVSVRSCRPGSPRRARRVLAESTAGAVLRSLCSF